MEEKNNDFYAVLGLQKDCSDLELRNAYKKLALKWHPDRCSASGSSKFVEESKKKFQAIQQAYSVLSDANKRLLYDVGVNDGDDDDAMGEFLNEMLAMMDQTKPSENGEEETFEELQELFEELLNGDIDSSNKFSASYDSYSANCSSSSSKRNNSFEKGKTEDSCYFDTQYKTFSMGVKRQVEDTTEKEREVRGRNGRSRGKHGKAHKISSSTSYLGHTVSS